MPCCCLASLRCRHTPNRYPDTFIPATYLTWPCPLRRKYVRARCALVCERLRCEPWRPCSQKNTDSHLIHSRPRQKGKQTQKLFINESKVVFGKRHRQNKLRQSSHKIESPKKSQTLSAQSSSRGNVLRKKLPIGCTFSRYVYSLQADHR